MTLEVLAEGGKVGPLEAGTLIGQGGAASLGPVFGHSRSGDAVRVVATVRTDRVDAAVVNAIDGETTGDLSLLQIAEGTHGTDASSRLEREVTAATASVGTEALGGRGSTPFEVGGEIAEDGGVARAHTGLKGASGDLTGTAFAIGGEAGEGPDGDGNGGDAYAYTEVIGEGAGHALKIGSDDDEVSGAVGGLGGDSLGGNAESESWARALGDGSVHVIDRATGGDGADGGSASSTAYGSNAGSAAVVVEATATGGDGLTGLGGGAHVTAEGVSVDGDVTVRATQQVGRSGIDADGVATAGRSTELRDAVHGSTAGLLTLEQTAIGGVGLGGGDATSRLRASNRGGGNISLRSEARGGDSLGNISNMSGGHAEIHAFGRSHAGDVRVEGVTVGGRGGRASATAEVRFVSGGDGASVALDNAVDGSTRGALELVQIAIAGGAGESQDGAAPQAGRASSVLRKTAFSRELTLRAEAQGGSAGGGAAEPIAAGTAHAEAHAKNLTARRPPWYAQPAASGTMQALVAGRLPRPRPRACAAARMSWSGMRAREPSVVSAAPKRQAAGAGAMRTVNQEDWHSGTRA